MAQAISRLFSASIDNWASGTIICKVSNSRLPLPAVDVYGLREYRLEYGLVAGVDVSESRNSSIGYTSSVRGVEASFICSRTVLTIACCDGVACT